WIASSRGHLWNTKTPEKGERGYMPKVGPIGFIMVCDKNNKPHIIIPSNSTSGKIYRIALPKGDVQQVFQQPSPLTHLARCGNDGFITADTSGYVRVWKMESDTPIATLEMHSKSKCLHLDAADDGSYIACTSHEDYRPSATRVWKLISPYKNALAAIAASKAEQQKTVNQQTADKS